MIKRYASTFLLIFFLLLIPASFVSSFRNGMLTATGSLGEFFVRQNVRLVNLKNNLSQISTLRSDKAALQAEVLSLRQQLATTGDIAQENQELRKELGVTGQTRTAPKVLAHIIVHGSDTLDRTVTVDIGADQGVKVGQPAVSQGFLIGTVIAARSGTAVIRYVTSKNSVVQARLSTNREGGLLVGDGNSVSLSDITQGTTVNPDDTVETSGLGGSLPQSILIGQISQAISKKSDLSQRFTVKLPKDPNGLESLFILLSDNGS